MTRSKKTNLDKAFFITKIKTCCVKNSALRKSVPSVHLIVYSSTNWKQQIFPFIIASLEHAQHLHPKSKIPKFIAFGNTSVMFCFVYNLAGVIELEYEIQKPAAAAVGATVHVEAAKVQILPNKSSSTKVLVRNKQWVLPPTIPVFPARKRQAECDNIELRPRECRIPNMSDLCPSTKPLRVAFLGVRDRARGQENRVIKIRKTWIIHRKLCLGALRGPLLSLYFPLRLCGCAGSPSVFFL